MTRTDAVAPGCTTPGNKAYWQCSICENYFSDEVGITEVELESTVIAATGHDYATAWTTDIDNHWHVCNNGCGVKDSDGAHTGGTATCTQKATCTVCSTQYGELAAHDLVHHEAKSPKCTEVGWNAYDTCNNCDYTTYVEIAATGHTKGDWIEDKASTCTEEGTKHKECTVCHTTLETGTIDMIPHTPGDAATCTTAQTCTKCNAVITAAKGHDYAAAWTTDGTNHWHVCNNGCGVKDSEGEHTGGTANCQQKATCTVCSQQYGELGGHVLEHHEAKSPKCTEVGWNAYDTCKLCDHTTYVEISATGHTASDWKEDKAPTCTEEGNKHKECTVCNTTLETGTIPKTGHNYSDEWTTDGSNHWHVCANNCGIKGSNAAHGFAWVIDKAATFTETGLRHEACPTCGLTRNENTVIPVKTCEHNNTEYHAKVPATCVKKGTVEYKYCPDCQKNLDMSDVELEDLEIAIDPDNHVAWGAWQTETAATCKEKGTEKRVCADCSHEETRELAINPDAHDLIHHEAQAATCLEKGWNAYDTCSRCDYTTYSETAALGHNFGEWETVKEATFTEDGEKKRECSRCDEFETEVISAKGVNENEITLNLAAKFTYGDQIVPVVSAKYGTLTLKWYDATTGEELAAKPVNAGSYKLVARVEENLEEGYNGAEEEAQFTIAKREITVTINAASSVAGEELEALTATVTSGSVLNGDTPYTLTTNADKAAMGTYAITGTCTNDNYNITFEDGVYIVSKKLEDPSGEIDLPVDINVEFKVTQSQTSSDYSELAGMKMGYWAQLWHRNEDGTLGDEFTDTMNCIITLNIPMEIIEGIRGGEKISRDKIAENLKLYYVDGDGDYVKVKTFTIAQKEDESWIVKFNYNGKFRAEVV
ncbi:MAG: hypothetical protein K2O67_04195, partial [Clostridia bacterium]|nr:hypothetical protein [Clostridia bacterium]